MRDTHEVIRFAGGVASGGSVYIVGTKVVPRKLVVEGVLFTTMGGGYVGSVNSDSYVDVWLQKGTEQYPPTSGADNVIAAHALVFDRATTGAAYGFSHLTPTSLFVPLRILFNPSEVMRVNGRGDNVEMFWSVFVYAVIL